MLKKYASTAKKQIKKTSRHLLKSLADRSQKATNKLLLMLSLPNQEKHPENGWAVKRFLNHLAINIFHRVFPPLLHIFYSISHSESDCVQ